MKGNEPKKSGKEAKQSKYKSSLKNSDEPQSLMNQKAVTKEEKNNELKPSSKNPSPKINFNN